MNEQERAMISCMQTKLSFAANDKTVCAVCQERCNAKAAEKIPVLDFYTTYINRNYVYDYLEKILNNLKKTMDIIGAKKIFTQEFTSSVKKMKSTNHRITPRT